MTGRFRLTVRTVVLVALLAAPACGTDADGPEQERILTSASKLYSNQDVIIRDFFNDRRGGVFVDVGCFDWKRGNNTLYLERHLGWSGIAVDALAHLERGYAANRPSTRFFNYIVTDRSGEIGTVYAMGALSSTKEDHAGVFEALEGVRGKPIEVPTITMDDLLEEAGIEKIDFLNMDIEEGEPAALAGFDIERFRPELVCIEAGETVRERIAAYFTEHDYERVDEYLAHDEINWYYRPRSAPQP